ncbi:zinc finger protein 43-like [Oppia nitens]|uniref:zinc finger protein 43-like n=1 Tax=Oppia nitens TaxID=1686743 RepID=UPI0023D9B082|nr:zinc finger protein 43-like [Oppia nitens]
MSGSAKAVITVNDLLDELVKENERLLGQLNITLDLIRLCEDYKQFVVDFCLHCRCGDRQKYEDIIDRLDSQYKTIIKDNCDKSETILTKNNNQMSDELIDGKKLAKNKVKRSQRHDFIKPKPIYSNINNECNSQTKRKIIGYLCNYGNCNYRNWSKGNVCRHVSKMHLNKRPLICRECRQTFWGQKRLLEHRKIKHMDQLIYNSNRNVYKCDYNGCVYECKSLSNLNQHKRRHIGDKPFKCLVEDCLSSFVTKSELKTHNINIHSNEYPFICHLDGCLEAFKTKERLKCHTFIHTNEWPFVCEWPGCDAKYAKNSDLRLHRLCIHCPEKPYPCEWPGCESTFKTKNGRRLHNFTHTGERPYRCEWPGCEASYYMISKLNRHKLSHNGIKRYQCSWPDCTMKYSTSHNLKLHLMAHRNDRPYVCDFADCQRRFTDKSQMKRHFKKVHKSDTK